MADILVVEDDIEILSLLEQFVKRTGRRVLTASNGAAAIELLKVETPDIILLDLAMPGVSGFDVLQHIQQDERLQNTRVIAVTAHIRMADQASSAGHLDGVLIKPFTMEELVDLLDGLS